jgi:hypothetical protein
MASIAVGAIFGIVSAATSASGWLWISLWAIDGVVFVTSLVLWLVARRAAAHRVGPLHRL